MKQTKIQELEKKLAEKTAENEGNMEMFHHWVHREIRKSKAINVLLPLIPQESIIDICEEIQNLRDENNRLKEQVKYFRSKKGRTFLDRVDKIGLSAAIMEMNDAPVKEVNGDLQFI